MKITIEVNDNNQLMTKLEGNVTLDSLTTALCTVQLGAMKQAVLLSPEETKEAATQTIYDLYNLAASNLLATFAPEIEMRPDLTATAILEMENKIIEEHYDVTVDTDGEVFEERV